MIVLKKCKFIQVIKVILASTSPRRQEILSQMGVEFDIAPSQFEEYLDDSLPPEEVASALGLGKAMAVARDNPEAIVIGSDTIVTVSKQLAKAASDDEARAMLKLASSTPNKITTSVAVLCLAEDIQIVKTENSYVYFKPYNEAEVDKYLATSDYRDKAGGYGVQSGAAPLVEYVVGNTDNIVGLPSHLLAPILESFGIKAQTYDYPLPVPRFDTMP